MPAQPATGPMQLPEMRNRGEPAGVWPALDVRLDPVVPLRASAGALAPKLSNALPPSFAGARDTAQRSQITHGQLETSDS